MTAEGRSIEEVLKALDKALTDLRASELGRVGELTEQGTYFVPQSNADDFAALKLFSQVFEEFYGRYWRELSRLSPALKRCRIQL